MTPKAIEADLLRKFKKINYWEEKRSDTTIEAYDSLESTDGVFKKKLCYYASKYPSTIRQKFNSLTKEGLTILTSDDGLFRVYSWDTFTGGSWHNFANVFQYKVFTKTGSYAFPVQSDDDFGDYYFKVYTIHGRSKTYYLTLVYGIYSGILRSEYIKCFEINKGTLNTDARIFKTPSGISNQIRYDYDLNKIRNKEPDILVNKTDETVKIPIISEEGLFLKKFITYKFTGQYFEKVK